MKNDNIKKSQSLGDSKKKSSHNTKVLSGNKKGTKRIKQSNCGVCLFISPKSVREFNKGYGPKVTRLNGETWFPV